jgi:hypothetical protein
VTVVFISVVNLTEGRKKENRRKRRKKEKLKKKTITVLNIVIVKQASIFSHLGCSMSCEGDKGIHAKVLRFKVFTAERRKFADFWGAVPCSLVEVHTRFRGSHYLHHQGPDGGCGL